MGGELLTRLVCGGHLEHHIDGAGVAGGLGEQILDHGVVHLLGGGKPDVEGVELTQAGGLGAVNGVDQILVCGGLGVVGLGGGGGAGAGLVDDGLHLLQSRQLRLGGLELDRQLLVGQILALHSQVGQGGVVGEEHIALLDLLTGVDQDLGDGLGGGEVEGLDLVGGDHAVALVDAAVEVGVAHHIHGVHGHLGLGQPGHHHHGGDGGQGQDYGSHGNPNFMLLHGLPPWGCTGGRRWCGGGRRGCGRSCRRTGRCPARG